MPPINEKRINTYTLILLISDQNRKKLDLNVLWPAVVNSPCVWLAIPHRMLTPRLDQPALRAIRMSGASLTEGIEKISIDGVSVPVFNLAKTIADCFKYRNKIGLDVALEALHEGWRQRRVTMDELWHYATIDRVANVMRPYMESLTA